jgi:hypothetical protein
MKTRISITSLLASAARLVHGRGGKIFARVALMGLAAFITLVVLTSSSIQSATAGTTCLYASGSDQLLPYDDCRDNTIKKVTSLGPASVDFFPVYNTTVTWHFDSLVVGDSEFRIRRKSDNKVIECYRKADYLTLCTQRYGVSSPQDGSFTAEVGTYYSLEGYMVGEDLLKQFPPKEGNVTFSEGIRLDPDDDRCYEAQPYYNLGGGATGHVDFSNDHDWHLINVSASGVLDVFLKVPFGKNYQLELWKDCSTRLQTSEKATSRDEEIKMFISPGTYRIHIYGADPTKDYSPDLSYTVTTLLIVDTTAPTCNVSYHPAEEDPNGYPSAWFTVQDTQSGFASEKIRYFVDNISFVGVDIPHGTTQPVTVKFYKNNLSKTSRVELWVWDLAGNGPTKCWLRNGKEGYF